MTRAARRKFFSRNVLFSLRTRPGAPRYLAHERSIFFSSLHGEHDLLAPAVENRLIFVVDKRKLIDFAHWRVGPTTQRRIGICSVLTLLIFLHASFVIWL